MIKMTDNKNYEDILKLAKRSNPESDYPGADRSHDICMSADEYFGALGNTPEKERFQIIGFDHIVFQLGCDIDYAVSYDDLERGGILEDFERGDEDYCESWELFRDSRPLAEGERISGAVPVRVYLHRNGTQLATKLTSVVGSASLEDKIRATKNFNKLSLHPYGPRPREEAGELRKSNEYLAEAALDLWKDYLSLNSIPFTMHMQSEPNGRGGKVIFWKIQHLGGGAYTPWAGKHPLCW